MKFSMVLFFICLMLGCTRGINQSELPGQYDFSLGNARQQITIRADGHYFNTFYRNGTLSWSDQGTWEYKNAGGEKGILLNRFKFGFQEYSSGGTWFVVPEKTLLGKRKLCFDSDLDRCFDR